MGQLKKTNIYITGNRPPMENVVFGSPLTVTTEITDSEENQKHTWYKLTTPNPSSGNLSSHRSAKIEFTTTEDNIEVEFKIKAQTNWDGNVTIGALDYYTDGVIDADYSIATIYGNLTEKIIKYQVPTKGKHFIQFEYSKSSNNSGDGAYICAWSNLNMPISEVKSVYVENSKIQQMNVQGKNLFEYGFNNTISWETLRWYKSNNSYTYNTKDRLTFSYYLSSKNYAYLYNSPNNIPNNGKINLVVFNNINSYYPNNSYNFTYKIDLSDWDTSNVTNMNNMFNDCTGLTYVDVSGFNTSNVNYMNRMFNWCGSLTYLDVSKWDTSKVSSMEFMFRGCKSLTYLDVSKWDTSKVINMDSMFYNCRTLTYLDVSKWDTSELYSLHNTFEQTGRINMIDMSNWNLSNLGEIGNSIGDLFFNSYCENIKLPNMNLNKPFNLNYGNAFKNLAYLKSFYAPELVNSKTTKVDILFYNDKELEYTDMHDWDFSNVTSANDMFYGCSSLISLIAGHESNTNVTALNGLKVDIDLSYCTKLNRESIMAIFRGLASLPSGNNKTITLPNKVKDDSILKLNIELSAESKNWNIVYK